MRETRESQTIGSEVGPGPQSSGGFLEIFVNFVFSKRWHKCSVGARRVMRHGSELEGVCKFLASFAALAWKQTRDSLSGADSGP